MILAIDPGKVSGYALIDDGEIVESGELHIDSAKGLDAAMGLVSRASVVVIEGMGYLPRDARFDTAYGLGRRAGLWEAMARIQAVSVQFVHPDTWQRAMLHPGGRNPGRDILKKLSVARAMNAVRRPVGENEADALNLGMWHWIQAGQRGAP